MKFMLSASSMILGSLFLMSGARADLSPLKWNDLEQGQSVQLTQELKIEELSLSRGTSFQIEEVNGLDMISVVELILRSPSCASPDTEAEMAIILPDQSPQGSEVGVEYRRGCTLAVYVEMKDLGIQSFFSLRE